MKTIYLISRAKSGAGPVNQTLNILEGLKQNGRVSSTLVTLAPEWADGSWLYKFQDKGISIFQMNHELLSTWRCIFELRKYVKNNGIEIVHACGFRADFVALFAGRQVKKIITQRCHPRDISEKLPHFMQSLCSCIYLQIIKRMDAIVACSKSIQSILKNEYSMDVYCVQNGVDTDFFLPPAEDNKMKLRKELGLPLNKKVYLVLGSLRNRKNNSLIVDAMNSINQDKFSVVFVGNGPEEDILKEKATNNNNIIFAGSTNTPIKYLQSADVLISSSMAEGLPNTVLEALSCGLPCILSDIGPHIELIEGTEAGIIFNRNSVEDLCNRLMDSCQWDMKSKSQEARRIAVDNFGVRSLAEKYEHIYEKVLTK